jgi:hypothetical protein
MSTHDTIILLKECALLLEIDGEGTKKIVHDKLLEIIEGLEPPVVVADVDVQTAFEREI